MDVDVPNHNMCLSQSYQSHWACIDMWWNVAQRDSMRRRLLCFSFVVNMFSQYFLSFIETKISGQKRVMFKVFFRMICNIDVLDLQLSVCTLMSKNCTVCRSGTIELTKLGQLCSSTISLVNEYPKPQKTKPGQLCLHNITCKTYKKKH